GGPGVRRVRARVGGILVGGVLVGGVRPSASLAEAARRGVGAVAEFPRRPQHGVPLLRPYRAGAAQDERDEGLGHTGPFGHVADRRRSHGLDRSIRSDPPSTPLNALTPL